MIAYPDTSFLIALYRWQVNSLEAIAHFGRLTEPLHVTSLVLFEFRQSVRLQEFLHQKNPRLGFDRASGQRAFADLQSDLSAGAVALADADWDDVLQIAERVSDKHTPREGHRSFDVLHVATALHFGVQEFLTFDAEQKRLAKTEGLKVPL
jgi:predicted nucleic acid-binding protein